MPSSERPTAVFATNDLLAIGLLQGFVTAGLRVPDDMAIVGYDDIAFAAAAAVPLSRSVSRGWPLVTRRLSCSLKKSRQPTAITHEHQQVRFTPELVVRRSTPAHRDAPRPDAPSVLVREFARLT